MAVLKGRGLEVSNCRETILTERCPEILHIILMVGAIAAGTDEARFAWPRVVLICGLQEIFERFVMRNVIRAR